jgi:uncharacterized protein YciI
VPWFVKLERGVVGKAEFDAQIEAHLAWVNELTVRGHQPSTGYWGDCKGRAGAGGMLLFQAGNWEEAEALVRTDPLIRAGCVEWVLHEWRVVAGALQAPTSAPGRKS